MIESKNQSSDKNTLQFIELSKKFRVVAEKLELPLRPPPQEIFEFYRLLPEPEQLAALGRMDYYYRFCVDAIEHEIERSEKHYAWFAIRVLGLVPPSELFNSINENDCIEIYDCSGIQIYRSFNFGTYTSYSLEEVMTYPWYTLFTRDQEIMDQLRATAGRIFSKQELKPFPINVPIHVCIEGLGKERLQTLVEFKIASPLSTKRGEITHFLATQRIRFYNQ